MLLRGSEESETRTLTIVGGVLLISSVIALTLFWAKPFGQARTDVVSIVVETPFVGQGVATGTAVILHGTRVGEVTSLSSFARGRVRLGIDLEQKPTAGLTDTFGIDFRPANYFGVTGINLLPSKDGQPLRDGTHLTIAPEGNYTLQALLSQLGDVANGVISPRFIDVIDKTTSYIDALTPLIQTMLIGANAVANVQTVSTERLLRNVTGISVASPGFFEAGIDSFDDIRIMLKRAGDDKFYNDVLNPALEQIGTKFFGQIGKLEAGHQYDLSPMISMIKSLSDVVPGIVLPSGIAETARELRTRLERMYAGSPDQRALQVQVVLDSLPGIAAPVRQMGSGQ